VSRPSRIVAEKQKALAGFVEPAHRRQCRQAGIFQALENSGPSLFVRGCRDQSARLIQHEVDLVSRLHGMGIDFDSMLSEVHATIGVAAKLAIHPHPARQNKFTAKLSGTKT
jgi:hypothetical protein